MTWREAIRTRRRAVEGKSEQWRRNNGEWRCDTYVNRAQSFCACKVDEGMSSIASGAARWGGGVRAGRRACRFFPLRELRGQGDPGDSTPRSPGGVGEGGGRLREYTLHTTRGLQDAHPGEAGRRRQRKAVSPGGGEECGRAALRRIAALLLLAGATSALPAEAQDPNHCTTAVAGQIWCATLTVAEDEGVYGFVDEAIGQLSPNSYVYSGNSADVYVLHYEPGESPPVLSFETDGDLGDGDGFELILGSVRLSLDGTFDEEKSSYVVENPGLSWSDGQKIQVRLVETPSNSAPTASAGSVAVNWNTEYAFRASDFNFSDTDMDDTLASVKVETLPASGKGRLKFDGATIDSTDLPKTVTKAELDANKLVYRPPANTYGSAFASFTFKVNDGTEDSASAYTMTIDVNLPSGRPVVVNTIPDQTAIVGTAFSFQFAGNVFVNPETGSLTYSATQYDRAALPSWLSFAAGTRTFSGTPASGDVGRLSVRVRATDGNGAEASDTFDIVVGSRPTISGTARVGQTLTAVTGSNGSFTYQWIQVDGMTETDISIATSSTYTLTTTDSGKKVKVKVSYSVNGMNTEAKSDAYPPHANIQPAAHGTASLTGRRQVWEGTLTVGADSVGPMTEVSAYGWSSAAGDLVGLDTVIDLGTNSYRIGRSVLLYAQVGDLVGVLRSPPGSLVFNLIGSSEQRDANGVTQELTATEKAALRLHVGNRSFDFSAATLLHYGDYEWQNADLVWAEGQSIALKLSVPTAFMNQGAADPPTVDGAPRVSGEGSDGTWAEGESVDVAVTFSEAVDVDTAGGTPSIEVGLGGTASRSAAYVSGSGTTELVFRYTLVEGDGSHTTMGVTPNSLALGGGTIRSVATDFDAELEHEGVLVQRRPPRNGGPTAEFQDVPASHDGEAAFKVGLRFSGAPAGLSAKRDAASVLEMTGGSVSRARATSKGANPEWEVTVAPDGTGDVTVRVPVRACGETNAVCIGERALAEAAEAVIPGPEPSEPADLDPITATWSSEPDAHDGTTRFDLHLDFSRAPVSNFSYRAIEGGVLNVEGGGIRRVWRRVRGQNDKWGVQVTPSGTYDVTVSVNGTTDCAAQHAVCTADGDMLEGGAQVVIPGPGPSEPTDPDPDPITATWSSKPDSHDGMTPFDLHLDFNRAPVNNFSYRAIEGGVLNVEGGGIRRVWRRVGGQNDQWGVQVTPSGTDDVAVSVNATTDCAAQHAVCTADGGMLEGGAQAVIPGPALLSVADARVEEDHGATLDFVVSLSRSRNAATTVEYATSDGSARAGEDYTASSGTLTFAANETSRTISVTVLDDAHDEGEETLTLRLSNPSGSRVADGEATGTIENRDPLPRALLARFGRTAAVHVVEHIEERLAASREPGFRGRFAGRDLRRGMEREMALNLLSQLGGGLAGSPGARAGGMGSGRTPGFAGGAAMGAAAPLGAMTGTMDPAGLGAGEGAVTSPMGTATGPAEGVFNGRGLLQMGLGGGDLLTGSDFALNRKSRGGILSFWSRGARSQFAGREGTLGLGGDVSTTMFGADYARGPIVAGLSLSRSRGLGEYAGAASGQVLSSV